MEKEEKERSSVVSEASEMRRLLEVPFFRSGEFVALFSRAQFERPPSTVHGIGRGEERQRRTRAVRLLQAMGRGLGVPFAVVGLAAVLLHRFYMVESMAVFPEWAVCGATLFSAAKIEEARIGLAKIARYLKDCANVGETELCKVMVKLQDTDMAVNQLCLFDSVCDECHHYLVPLCTALRATLKLQCAESALKSLAKNSWQMADSSLQTVACLLIPAPLVAICCVELALRSGSHLSAAIPSHWFRLFDDSLKLDTLRGALKLTAAAYVSANVATDKRAEVFKKLSTERTVAARLPVLQSAVGRRKCFGQCISPLTLDPSLKIDCIRKNDE